ncbi:MAG: flippase-like domain-containing protein [Sphingomonadaceae bacterium]|nr:flippase-like domain-containing protein [Sphingomonadaceae bacterium]
MSRLGWATIAATAAGLALALWMLGIVGARQTFHAMAQIGAPGFVLFLASYGLVLVALGGAWAVSGRFAIRQIPAFVVGRAVREAANDLLPFSQIGGLVLGLKVVASAGIAPARAYAATVIDLTTEIVSQLMLVLLGVAIALGLARGIAADARLQTAIWSGTALLCAFAAGVLLLRRPALNLIARMANRVVPAAAATMDAVRDELAALERGRFSLLPSLAWNLAAWLLSVFSIWLALRLLGHPLVFSRVLALEALISVVRSSAFLLPGALGAQEAGYVLLGALVGLDRETALALSLLKRARDLAIGVPTLLVWQGALVRRAAILSGVGEPR